MSINWNFQKSGVANQKKPSVGGVWVFSGTIRSVPNQFIILKLDPLKIMEDFCFLHLHVMVRNLINYLPCIVIIGRNL